MLGKNPVMMLHEIRPSFECEIESDEHKGAHRKVVMSITVEEQKFLGSGRSNKNARARAAVAALESLFGLEFTDFGESKYFLRTNRGFLLERRLCKKTGSCSINFD